MGLLANSLLFSDTLMIEIYPALVAMIIVVRYFL